MGHTKISIMKQLLLRMALSATFLSAVASRLGFWGGKSGGWKAFIEYTSEVCAWAPNTIVPFLSVSATLLETVFALLLLIGYKTKWAAMGASILTLFFALSMTCSMGVKEPLDYSVFVFSAAALLLSEAKEYKWSMDNYSNKRKYSKS
jgi:uncharacterized membrane protein YphA (DoxX/SURF4 family)